MGAPIFRIDILEENMERLGLDIDHFLEILGDPAHQFFFLLFGSSLVHMNVHYRHVSPPLLENDKCSITRAKEITQEARRVSVPAAILRIGCIELSIAEERPALHLGKYHGEVS